MKDRWLLSLRLLMFFVTFSVEVRVKADTVRLPLAKEFLEEPEQCWGNGDIPCAVRSPGNTRTSVEFATTTITLDQGSAFARVGKSELRLISGTVWIKSKDEINVRSEFGDFHSDGGEFWLTHSVDKVVVSSVEGVVLMHPRGPSTADTIEVSTGLENWLGRVATDGRARSGIPTAIPLKPHLVRWARLFPGTRTQFEKEAQLFHQRWASATPLAAEIHHELYARKTASLEAAKVHAEEQHRENENKNRALREMFRQRVFEQ